MSDIRAQLERLKALDDSDAKIKRRRGQKFEEFLLCLLLASELKPRIRFRPEGEEIDGSFELDKRTYLLEAKWHASPLPASAVYTFKGKVEGKLIGTVGIFVSMSGFSADAINALTAGKHINVLLLDNDDIEASVEHGISRVLRTKIRAAAEEGAVFYPFTSAVAAVSDAGIVKNREALNDESATGEVVIVCEGSLDAKILKTLALRVTATSSESGQLRVIAAQGKHGIPRVANAIYPLVSKLGKLVIVADGDGEERETTRRITEALSIPFELVVIEPELESWFELDSPKPKEELRRKAREARTPFDQYVSEKAETLDMAELLKTSDSFARFQKAILSALRQDSE
jgi:hypothetical protein